MFQLEQKYNNSTSWDNLFVTPILFLQYCRNIPIEQLLWNEGNNYRTKIQYCSIIPAVILPTGGDSIKTILAILVNHTFLSATTFSMWASELISYYRKRAWNWKKNVWRILLGKNINLVLQDLREINYFGKISDSDPKNWVAYKKCIVSLYRDS